MGGFDVHQTDRHRQAKGRQKPKFHLFAYAIRAGIFVDQIYMRVTNTALMQFLQEVVKAFKILDDWSFDLFHSAKSQ